eukprot:COSAG06_NODE_5513_length_3429_cov_1.853629_3_plen_178_part_01
MFTATMVCLFCSNTIVGLPVCLPVCLSACLPVCLPVSEQEEYALLDVKLEGDTRAASERLRCARRTIFVLKPISLPRLAWDKHNETLNQESRSFRRLLSLGVSYGGRGAATGGAASAGVRKRFLCLNSCSLCLNSCILCLNSCTLCLNSCILCLNSCVASAGVRKRVLFAPLDILNKP